MATTDRCSEIFGLAWTLLTNGEAVAFLFSAIDIFMMTFQSVSPLLECPAFLQTRHIQIQTSLSLSSEFRLDSPLLTFCLKPLFHQSYLDIAYDIQ